MLPILSRSPLKYIGTKFFGADLKKLNLFVFNLIRALAILHLYRSSE